MRRDNKMIECMNSLRWNRSNHLRIHLGLDIADCFLRRLWKNVKFFMRFWNVCFTTSCSNDEVLFASESSYSKRNFFLVSLTSINTIACMVITLLFVVKGSARWDSLSEISLSAGIYAKQTIAWKRTRQLECFNYSIRMIISVVLSTLYLIHFGLLLYFLAIFCLNLVYSQ